MTHKHTEKTPCECVALQQSGTLLHPVVVKVVMVILVKIDFRKGHFYTIIYKYIYIIYYRTLFLLFHFDFDHFDHDHHDHMTTQKKSGGNRKKSPKDSSTAMKSSYFCSVE